MVPIDAGIFEMGWFVTDADRYHVGTGDNQATPVRTVAIEDTFAMSAHEVTVGEFRLFADRTRHVTVAERAKPGRRPFRTWRFKSGCIHGILSGNPRRNAFHTDVGLTWRNPGYPSTDRHPVGCIALADAIAYAEWLATETGRPYRLPSEAEWEYAARAGRSTVELRNLVEDNDLLVWTLIGQHRETETVEAPAQAAFAPTNPFGLHGLGTYAETGWYMAEWTADCWRAGYADAPTNGEPSNDGDCRKGVTRGHLYRPFAGRNVLRFGSGAVSSPTLGFRVVRSPMSGPLVDPAW